jgi:hypothetical protein
VRPYVGKVTGAAREFISGAAERPPESAPEPLPEQPSPAGPVLETPADSQLPPAPTAGEGAIVALAEPVETSGAKPAKWQVYEEFYSRQILKAKNSATGEEITFERVHGTTDRYWNAEAAGQRGPMLEYDESARELSAPCEVRGGGPCLSRPREEARVPVRGEDDEFRPASGNFFYAPPTAKLNWWDTFRALHPSGGDEYRIPFIYREADLKLHSGLEFDETIKLGYGHIDSVRNGRGSFIKLFDTKEEARIFKYSWDKSHADKAGRRAIVLTIDNGFAVSIPMVDQSIAGPAQLKVYGESYRPEIKFRGAAKFDFPKHATRDLVEAVLDRIREPGDPPSELYWNRHQYIATWPDKWMLVYSLDDVRALHRPRESVPSPATSDLAAPDAATKAEPARPGPSPTAADEPRQPSDLAHETEPASTATIEAETAPLPTIVEDGTSGAAATSSAETAVPQAGAEAAHPMAPDDGGVASGHPAAGPSQASAASPPQTGGRFRAVLDRYSDLEEGRMQDFADESGPLTIAWVDGELSVLRRVPNHVEEYQKLDAVTGEPGAILRRDPATNTFTKPSGIKGGLADARKHTPENDGLLRQERAGPEEDNAHSPAAPLPRDLEQLIGFAEQNDLLRGERRGAEAAHPAGQGPRQALREGAFNPDIRLGGEASHPEGAGNEAAAVQQTARADLAAIQTRPTPVVPDAPPHRTEGNPPEVAGAQPPMRPTTLDLPERPGTSGQSAADANLAGGGAPAGHVAGGETTAAQGTTGAVAGDLPDAAQMAPAAPAGEPAAPPALTVTPPPASQAPAPGPLAGSVRGSETAGLATDGLAEEEPRTERLPRSVAMEEAHAPAGEAQGPAQASDTRGAAPEHVPTAGTQPGGNPGAGLTASAPIVFRETPAFRWEGSGFEPDEPIVPVIGVQPIVPDGLASI